ncbi:MAG TPA: hypothetical protein VD791_03110, partial [Burkholderiales bacterium]|nr:hypothetical protein [Burkholderiales bacterium]
MWKNLTRRARITVLLVIHAALPLSLLGILTASQSGEAAQASAAPGFSIKPARPWTASGVRYRNAQEYVVTGKALGRKEKAAAAAVLAHMLVTTEPRTSHEDALKRLADIAASRDATIEYVEIGGWPAVELQFTEALRRRGQAADGSEPVQVPRAITAIAAGNKVLHFDVSLAPEAPLDLLDTAKGVARTATFPKRGNPEEVKRALETLPMEVTRRRSLRQPSEEPVTTPPSSEGAESTRPNQALEVAQGTRRPSDLAPSMAAAAGQAAPGAGNVGAVRVQNGVGELEIAASANAMNVVIASNAALSFSTNRGSTYAAGATGVFGLNDPTLARAVSGNFYLGVIAFPNGTAAHLNVTGCTNAVSRSTDNGANFALQGYSARCPQSGTGLCFPDQEHIAADTVTASGGNDQLYAVWRNFTPAGTPPATCAGIGSGFVAPSISCSQNNGTTWTATAVIPGAGDFPRVAVGRDGSVFVVTLSGNSVLLNRFASCANGLTAAAGFPVTVATLSGAVVCPVSGLDRCNDGNTLSSPTVAPDPANANHLFVSFAERDGAGGERIVTRESTDRGATFPTARTVSANQSTRRFMPWVCSARGAAWTGWYDRRASGAAGASNDLTDYFLGSTLGHEWNLSGNADPQCASGWPCAPRSTNDSESCTIQPQLAGVCRAAGGGGSGNRCDFSSPACPAGETCMGGGGCPKYGDYNGVACSGNFVFAAWASATTPPGVPAGTGLRVFSSTLFVARNGASIWRHTGTPCAGDSCPGWQRLDNNHKTVSIVSAGSRIYQLHNDGWIWQGTGTACSSDSCPGWIRLDNNSKTIAIAAADGQLYQLHNDGWIWRYTGTPCSGDSCPGWQRLDNNPKTTAIAAAGSQLYQLHN